MEIDTASLVVHRDTDSIMTWVTDNLSKFALDFIFDSQLLITNVYKRAIRGSVKDALRLQNLDHNALKKLQAFRRSGKTSLTIDIDSEAVQKSQAIDRQLQLDKKKRMKECRILALGTAISGKEEIIRFMKRCHGYNEHERKMLASTIRQHLHDSLRSIISELEQRGIEVETKENQHFCLVVKNDDRLPRAIQGTPIGKAICSFWADSSINKLMVHSSKFLLSKDAAL